MVKVTYHVDQAKPVIPTWVHRWMIKCGHSFPTIPGSREASGSLLDISDCTTRLPNYHPDFSASCQIILEGIIYWLS